jgi:hypothetical protein
MPIIKRKLIVIPNDIHNGLRTQSHDHWITSPSFNPRKLIVIQNDIHNGLRTQSHDHWITSPSFNPIKRIVKNITKPIPPLLLLLSDMFSSHEVKGAVFSHAQDLHEKY